VTTKMRSATSRHDSWKRIILRILSIRTSLALLIATIFDLYSK